VDEGGKRLTRRDFLRGATLAAAGALVAACAPEPEVVTQVVKETVVVEVEADEIVKEVEVQKVVTATPPPEEAITLVVVHWAEAEYVDAHLVPMWEARFPNRMLDIRYTPLEGYLPKLTMALASGDPPDVYFFTSSTGLALAHVGAVRPLNSYMDAMGWDWGKYWPMCEKTTDIHLNGMTFGIPREILTTYVYYNMDLFDEYGVEYPTNEWTFQDMLEAAKALTLDTNGDGETDIFGWHCNYGSYKMTNGMRNWGSEYREIVAEDGKTFNLNTPETQEMIAFFADLILESNVCPNPELGQGANFSDQTAAMYDTGQWHTGGLRQLPAGEKFRWGAVIACAGPEGVRSSYADTKNWGIPMASRYPDEAWDWVVMATSPEGIEPMITAGNFLPPFKPDTCEGFQFGEGMPEDHTPYCEGLNYAFNWPRPGEVGSRNAWDTYMGMCRVGQITPAECLQKWAEDSQKAIDDWWAQKTAVA